jgi:hypothetical protein
VCVVRVHSSCWARARAFALGLDRLLDRIHDPAALGLLVRLAARAALEQWVRGRVGWENDERFLCALVRFTCFFSFSFTTLGPWKMRA